MIKNKIHNHLISQITVILIFSNCTAYYGIQGKQYVREIKGKYHILEASHSDNSEVLIYGCVIDKKTEEPIFDARIFIPGMLEVTTRSDSTGGFILKIPTGTHVIKAEAAGHNFIQIPERSYVSGDKVKVLFELGRSEIMEKWRYR